MTASLARQIAIDVADGWAAEMGDATWGQRAALEGRLARVLLGVGQDEAAAQEVLVLTETEIEAWLVEKGERVR